MGKESHQDLAGLSALVTGGARNIGLAIAKELTSRGASVAIADIGHDLETIPYALATADQMARAVDELTRMGGHAIGMPCDVRDEGQVRETVDRVIQDFGRLDILVNNAGVGSLYPVQSLTAKAWNEVVDVCLKGTFLCCKYAVPQMIKQRNGRIINIASVAGLRGLGYSAHYCAAKHGVIGLTRALAVELANHGIQVLAVCPGTVESSSLQGLASRWAWKVIPTGIFRKGICFRIAALSPKTLLRLLVGWLPGNAVALPGLF